VAGTDDDSLYQFFREDPEQYLFAVPNGTYQLVLHFAEFEVSKDQERVMRVLVETAQVEPALSIYAEVGKDTAFVRSYTVTVTDGQLNVVFVKEGGKKKPVVSAIQIVQVP
jgi:hypothetical protein